MKLDDSWQFGNGRFTSEGEVGPVIFYKEFKSEEELKKGLEKIGMGYFKARETAAHERQHFEKAKELGYDPRYVVLTWVEEHPQGYFRKFQPMINIHGKPLSREDEIKITRAPSDLSPSDIGDLIRLQQLNRR